jgi:ribosomal protein L31E
MESADEPVDDLLMSACDYFFSPPATPTPERADEEDEIYAMRPPATPDRPHEEEEIYAMRPEQITPERQYVSGSREGQPAKKIRLHVDWHQVRVVEEIADCPIKDLIGDNRLHKAGGTAISLGKKMDTFKCQHCNFKKRVVQHMAGEKYPDAITYIEQTAVDGHNCTKEQPCTTFGIDNLTKKLIDDMVDEGFTEPRKIAILLSSRHAITHYSNEQIKNYKCHSRKAARAKTTTHELREFCEKHSHNTTHSDNIDTPFVRAYWIETDEEPEPKFRVAISTTRLMGHRTDMMHADGTYKVSVDNFPCTLYGCSDSLRHFHLNMFGISSSENHDDYSYFFQLLEHLLPRYIMTDAAAAISNGAREVWAQIVRCMCFAHVYNNMRKEHLGQFGLKDDESALYKAKIQFLNDLELVACSPTEAVFVHALHAMCEKYRNHPEYADKFAEPVSHLAEYWGHSSRNTWYVGVTNSFFVRNNNGLESWNKYFKLDCTLHRRLNLLWLLTRALLWIETVSKSYSESTNCQNRRLIIMNPHIERSLYLNEWEYSHNFYLQVFHRYAPQVYAIRRQQVQPHLSLLVLPFFL